MASDQVKRKLAAILAADIAGYSRLMGADEAGTLARLKEYRRELIDPKNKQYRGRVVKTTGDGILIEFPSVVDAVCCSIEVQRGMRERNADVPPEKRIEFRIGINLGDVIIEGRDLYGDGVNIAARLEGLAEPGGICISQTVLNHARGKIAFDVEDLGERALKNIVQPIHVYRLLLNSSRAWAESRSSESALALPEKPSIAVLPFQNMSGDPEQEYFADGIVEDIITALSRFKALFVIARNSSFTYKGRAVDIKQVGRELGVRYVLEGSVRKAANRVRITGQLVDTATGGHLWADRFDGGLTDIFDLQDQITESIVGAIAPAVEKAEIERAKRKPTTGPPVLVEKLKASPRWAPPPVDRASRFWLHDVWLPRGQAHPMAGRSCYRIVVVLLLLLGGLLGCGRAWALGDEPRAGETLTQYLTPEILQAIFPGADRIREVEGTPPSAAVYKSSQPLGYVFSTWDVTQSRGFSNRPIVLLVGVSNAGRITGVKLVHHMEPIGILGLHDEDFFRFAEQFKDYDIKNGVDVVKELTSSPLGKGTFSQRAMPGAATTVKVDAVARATTSSVLMSDAVVRGARVIARSRGILPAATVHPARLDIDGFQPVDWPMLEATGAIGHLHLTYHDVLEKLRQHGAIRIKGGDAIADSADVFLDLYIALATPAGIGINLLDKTLYDQYSAGRGIDDQMLLITANSSRSVIDTSSDPQDTIPIELVQRDKTIRISNKQIKALPFIHAKAAPELTERALVFLSNGDDFEPTQPFEVRLLVAGEVADGRKTFADFTLPYRLPDKYLLAPPPASAETSSGLAWRAIWQARQGEIAVLSGALLVLTGILLMRNWISRRPRLHRALRVGFLTWTLGWLGWYAGAQLTVVQVISWIHTLVTDFRWDYLLADPLITILLGFTIVGLFLWGRAAYCGWLCPFGALQELVSEAARRLRVPQVRIPVDLHGRLVVGKYVLFVALVGASFVSWDLAMAGTEIEPFKAAIVLRFMTEWPMVVYALALVAASLFIERFYCRFACPLGGGLAIFGKLRMVNWLKRHPECGSRCRFCESVCPVGAIRRDGRINMNECFFCLDCQVTYYDDHTCPPMVWRRKRLEQQGVPVSASGPGAGGR